MRDLLEKKSLKEIHSLETELYVTQSDAINETMMVLCGGHSKSMVKSGEAIPHQDEEEEKKPILTEEEAKKTPIMHSNQSEQDRIVTMNGEELFVKKIPI